MACDHWNIRAIPGVELTHVPAAAIAEAAAMAKKLGAQIVVVHGETLVEPVEPGTNMAAVQSRDVDILAHPGLISREEAVLAKANGIFLEISARKGHSLCNGHVARISKESGAMLLLDSDAHASGDLLTSDFARNIARGAGLDEEAVHQMLELNPTSLLNRLSSRDGLR